MANTLANIARMTTTTTGAGTITLGSAVTGFLSFADAGISNGDVVTYAIEEGNEREIGQGTYSSAGPTLTRSTVYSSTASGSQITLLGAAEVFITAAKEDFATFRVDDDVYNVTDAAYGAVGDGATNDAAAIQAANDAAEAAGGGVVFYPPGTYRINSQITCDSSNVVHVGSGIGRTTIEVNSNSASAILFQGSRTTGDANTLASNADQGDTTVTLSSGKGANFAAGDWALILDEATITGTAQKQGELVRVRSVATDTLTLHAPLRYSYTTGNSAQVQVIDMLTGSGVKNMSVKKVTPASSTASLLTFLYCDGARISDVEVYDNAQQGASFFGCVGHVVDFEVRDLLSSSGSNYFGYGVQECGANVGGRFEINAQRVRHAYTTIQSTSVLPYGVPTASLVTGTAVDTYLSAWDTHEEAQSITFDSCTSRGSGMAGFQIRGKGCQVIGGVTENSIGPGVYMPNSAEDTLISGVTIDYSCLGTDEDSTDWTDRGGILDNGERSSIVGCLIKNAGGPGIELESSYGDCYISNCRIIDPCRVTTTVKDGISNLETTSTTLHIDGVNISCSDTRMDYGVRITSANCDALISGVRVSGAQTARISRQDEHYSWNNESVGPVSFGPQEAFTIASGAINITNAQSGFIGVDGEGGAADDLATITGGYDGQLILLRRTASNTITIKHATGNILTSTGADVAIDSSLDLFLLVYRPSNWIMLRIS